MRLLLIGTESSHALHFSRALRAISPMGGITIDGIWCGDAPNQAWPIRDIFASARLVRNVESVIDGFDAVIITLRRASEHYAFAELALQHGKCVFIDKPFTAEPAEAASLLRAAEQYGGGLTGGSTLCFLPEFKSHLDTIRAAGDIDITYHADPDSPFEGWRFYGSHLTDLVTDIFADVPDVIDAARDGDRIAVSLKLSGRQISLRTTNDQSPPVITAGNLRLILNEATCYLWGMRHFLDVVGGKTEGKGYERLQSVRLMHQIEDSLQNQRHAVQTTI